MEITFTLKEAGIFLIFVAVIILLIYVIILVRGLIPAVKNTKKITDDAAVITSIARKRTEDLDGVLDDVTDSVHGLSEALKGKESLVQSLSSIGKAITSLIGLLKKGNEES